MATEALDQECKSMVADLRATFVSGKTQSLEWRRSQLEQVHKMFRENHEEITAAVRADLGGSKLRGLAELSPAQAADHALDHLDDWVQEKWVAGWVDRHCIRPEPKGVVLVIGTWNFPFTLTLGPLVPAIAAGNCVVLKPCEINPTCAPLLAKLVKKYMDPDCIRVVEGAVPEVTALLNQRWDHIFYTGNTGHGKIIMKAAAEHLTPVTLELGGKCPVIADETAQMDVLVNRVSCAKWLNCGQICVAPDYVLVHESKVDEFLHRAKAALKQCYGEDPKNSPEYCRIGSARHVDRVESMIETSKGEIVCGGTDGIDKDARYVPPTIIKQPSLDAPLMQEEIFGPVLPVISFEKLDDALTIVKQRETPLAMYVYSQNAANIEKILTNLPSGGSCVNSSMEHILCEDVPFGGKGASGMGCYHGKFGFDELSHKRTVLRKSTLPGCRGTFIPLPSAAPPAWPTQDAIYDIAVKMSLGVMPRGLKAQLHKKMVRQFGFIALLGLIASLIS